MFYKFKDTDIFRQTIVTNPKYSFTYATTYDGTPTLYVNNPIKTGTAANIRQDALNKTEINVNRTGSQLIYPYIEKTDSNIWFSSVTSASYSALTGGSIIQGNYQTYPFLYKDYINNTSHPVYKSLKNIWNSYKKYNSLFDFDTNPPLTGAVHIFSKDYYGSSIKKGSVTAGVVFLTRNDDNTAWYRNTRIAQDIYKDGILRITTDNGYNETGTIVGYVLYEYGAILFKSATILDYYPSSTLYNNKPHQADQVFTWDSGSEQNFSWAFFGDDFFSEEGNSRSYCYIDFEGTNNIENLTLMCHAHSGELNNSNNPSFLRYGQNKNLTSSAATSYTENSNLYIKNVVSSSFNTVENFDKETYISEIYIYDENKNLLGIAQLANPLRKKEKTDYTFKIKYDLG